MKTLLFCAILAGFAPAFASDFDQTVNITINDFAPYFTVPGQQSSRQVAQVPFGAKIVWYNSTGVYHTIQFLECPGECPAVLNAQGREAIYMNDSAALSSFLAPGRYVYQCGIHDIMRGEFEVLEPGASSQL